MKSFAALIDEHHTPPLRYTLGRLLSVAKIADLAIAHVRLAGLDLSASETGSLRHCRVVLGRLDAAMLLDAGGSDAALPGLRRLAAFAGSGRLGIRAAPHHTWNPDFSVFAGLPANTTVALVGAHYFQRPYPRYGTAFTCVLTGAAPVRLCRARFEDLWNAGYDILPVVRESLDGLARNAS